MKMGVKIIKTHTHTICIHFTWFRVCVTLQPVLFTIALFKMTTINQRSWLQQKQQQKITEIKEKTNKHLHTRFAWINCELRLIYEFLSNALHFVFILFTVVDISLFISLFVHCTATDTNEITRKNIWKRWPGNLLRLSVSLSVSDTDNWNHYSYFVFTCFSHWLFSLRMNFQHFFFLSVLALTSLLHPAILLDHLTESYA